MRWSFTEVDVCTGAYRTLPANPRRPRPRVWTARQSVRTSLLSTRIDSEPYIYDGRLRKGAAKRVAILDRAVEIASIEGLSGLTIGRLAADLAISKGHLTQLLGSKQELQL